MQYDDAKVEDAVLALLGVFEFDNGRAWKRFDFDVMEALFAKGLITDPRGRQESVHLTDAGLLKAKSLAHWMFAQR
jgi:hypothetical protein